MNDELERQFRQSLRLGILDTKVHTAALRLRNQIESDILSNIDLALANNLDGMLWKVVHYKLIEEFRRKLKQSIINIKQLQSVNNQQAVDEEKNLWRSLSVSFRYFLTDATGFYVRFISKIQYLFQIVDNRVIKELDLVLQDQSGILQNLNIIKPSKQSHEKIIMVVYRSLVYLGDLARYREVHADKKKKNWGLSRKFYRLAMYLMPENGNPFNQLAVIDTYQASEFSAIEMYFRSLVVKKPFSTAMDNLLLLFQKSSAKFETISDHTNSSHFQTYFITLHSYLFGNAKDMNKFIHHSPKVIKALKTIISTPDIGKTSFDWFSKLLIINLSALYVLDNHNEPKSFEYHPVVQFLLQLCHTMLEYFHKLSQTNDFSNFDGTHGYIPVVKIIINMVMCQTIQDYYQNGKTQHEFKLVFDCLATIVSQLSKQVAEVLQFTNSQVVSSSRSNTLPQLLEDRDLIGFLPLEPFTPKPIDQSRVSLDLSELEDQDFVYIQCHQILAIARYMCSLQTPVLYERVVKGRSKYPVFSTERPSNIESTGLSSASQNKDPIWNSSSSVQPNRKSPSTSPLNFRSHGLPGSVNTSVIGNGLAGSSPQSAPIQMEVDLPDPNVNSSDTLGTLSFLGLGSPPPRVNSKAIRNSNRPVSGPPLFQTTSRMMSPSIRPLPPGLNISNGQPNNFDHFFNGTNHIRSIPPGFNNRTASPTFFELSPHQQNMVSPLWNEYGNASPNQQTRPPGLSHPTEDLNWLTVLEDKNRPSNK